MDIETVKSVTLGALSVKQTDGEIRFYRMTDAQTEAFTRENADFDYKTHATAGIRLDFFTDTEFLDIAYRMEKGSSRRFGYIDIYSDDRLTAHIGTDDRDLSPAGRALLRFDGKKHRIRIFLSNLSATVITRLEWSANAIIEPFKPDKKLLCYGDSITHGYDARFPSRSYVNLLALNTGDEVVNQAVGGARFNPEVIGKVDRVDLITVAYGTNDWKRKSRQQFVSDADGFFARLREVHGNTPVYALLPIWRGDHETVTACGSFRDTREEIARIAEKYNARPVDTIDFVPHDASFFSPDCLHPNDAGFERYYNGIRSVF